MFNQRNISIHSFGELCKPKWKKIKIIILKTSRLRFLPIPTKKIRKEFFFIIFVHISSKLGCDLQNEFYGVTSRKMTGAWLIWSEVRDLTHHMQENWAANVLIKICLQPTLIGWIDLSQIHVFLIPCYDFFQVWSNEKERERKTVMCAGGKLWLGRNWWEEKLVMT